MVYQQDVKEIEYNTRKREWVKTRQVIFYIITTLGKVSSNQIAKHYSMNHATILHALKVIKGYMSWDRDIRREVADIIAFMTPKAQVELGGYNLHIDFYYIPLDNFVSIREGNKAVILTGFTDAEIQSFVTKTGINQAVIKHEDTKLYILEDRNKILRQLKNESDDRK